MRYYSPLFSGTQEEIAQQKQVDADVIRTRGTEKRPDPPRNLIAVGSSRKILFTWNAPEISRDVTGYRVYKDTENNLYDDIKDANRRQCEIAATPGATALLTATVNIFVSTVNGLGKESRKVQVQGKPTAEAAGAAPPPEAVPPPAWVPDPDGGNPAEPSQDRLGRFYY